MYIVDDLLTPKLFEEITNVTKHHTHTHTHTEYITQDAQTHMNPHESRSQSHSLDRSCGWLFIMYPKRRFLIKNQW